MTDVNQIRHQARQELYAELIKKAEEDCQSARNFKIKRAKDMIVASLDQMEGIAKAILEHGAEVRFLDDLRLHLEGEKRDERETFENG